MDLVESLRVSLTPHKISKYYYRGFFSPIHQKATNPINHPRSPSFPDGPTPQVRRFKMSAEAPKAVRVPAGSRHFWNAAGGARIQVLQKIS